MGNILLKNAKFCRYESVIKVKIIGLKQFYLKMSISKKRNLQSLFPLWILEILTKCSIPFDDLKKKKE